MMGDVALGAAPCRRLVGVAEGRQRHRQDAHGGAIAGVAFEEWSFDRALRDVAADAAAAGVADIERTGLQPGGEFLANVANVESPHRTSERPSAKAISVSSVTWPGARRSQPPPMILRWTPYRAAISRLGHELDRGAERVADGKAEKGRERPVLQAQGRHRRRFLVKSSWRSRGIRPRSPDIRLRLSADASTAAC